MSFGEVRWAISTSPDLSRTSAHYRQIPGSADKQPGLYLFFAGGLRARTQD